MTSLEEVDRQVREVLITTFNLSREAVTPEATLFQDLDLDSLDAIDPAVKLDIESGLIPRFATFWCTPKEPVAYPPPPDEEKLRHLSTDLAAIGKFAADVGALQGYLNLSPVALKEWEITYRDLTQATREAPKAVAAMGAGRP